MPTNLYPYASALLSAVIALLILIPLARIVPQRLITQWQANEDTFLVNESTTAEDRNYSLSLNNKLLLIFAATVSGFLIIHQFGLKVSSIALSAYFLSLLLLAAIDLQHDILPDVIVFPTLICGVLSHIFQDQGYLFIVAAILAYALPYALVRLLYLLTKKELLGGGDLKCFAMAGAWFGIDSLGTFFLIFFATLCMQIFALVIFRHASRQMPTALAHLSAAIFVAAGIAYF
ncbi:prepilin peptidase [Undibacterium umbellatum]|uniref:Prepilin peptidase n=1 Tax=Undibacterium umbellatum TaxID=2762300 RepID=A0ABR6Z7Q3_9BURK|nr:A24 family peptidase [Undibacterium umbellatum]MBC3907798.1 prepilin peptidase [Undibacterium umbellatum]